MPGGKGKFILILFPVVAAGAVLGLAHFGVINIKGITPKKPAPVAKADGKDANPEVAVKKAPPKPKPQASAPALETEDPVKGAKKIAAVWESVPPDQLSKIIANYKDPDLAAIFNVMDEDVVAKVLALMKPDRASSISKAMQKLAEKVKAPPPSQA